MATTNNDEREHEVEQAIWQFLDAQLRGSDRDIEELVKKYPEFEDRIRQKIAEFQKVDSLLDSLVQADESDFTDISDEHDLVGKSVGSFEIKEIIGRGGMGVVYLAHDTRLKRSVAVKGIPAELQASSTARTRFRREAELLASLNHPNIGAIHEIIEQDESAGYLILEYVPGETLAQHIAREPLKIEEALSIGQQIAEAVSAAHEKGIVHRDLKPGNIKITAKGKVKVLDFGLAKASASQDKNQSTTITQPGRVMGTPAYMSPEQARGKSTDHHTDIWSFGCIMYQMLTGKLPFEGETATDTVAQILEREPDWQALPQETPENICVLLRQCLEKNQDERLADIACAAIEIKETLTLPGTATATKSKTPVLTLWRLVVAIGLTAGAIVLGLNIGRLREKLPGGSSRIESIAVLPLQNLTGDPNKEYFSESMTDVLISDLGTIGVPRVISRQSVMRYKGSDKSLPEITRELKVDAVVEGAVLSVEESVKITARLISAVPERQLWSQKYDRDFGDMEILLRDLAQAVARQIGIISTPEQEVLLATKRPVNPEMYRAYLKGMFHLNKETPEGTKIGLAYLQQAIEKDPEEPLAYGALALGYAVSAHGPGAPLDAFEKAKAAASKALELDQNLAEAHAALAMAKVYRDWDWEGAAKAYQRALQLNPNLNMIRAQYAFYLLLFESADDALAEMRRIQETDPLTPLWPAYQGWLYLHAEQYDEAIKEANKSLELYPDFHLGLYIQGRAYAVKGMYEKAIELHKKASGLSPQWKCGLAHTYAMAGRLNEARRVLAELEANHTLWDTWFIAIIYVAMGEKDQAFKWLEMAYGPPNHPYLPFMRCVPVFKPLRDDPRFSDLLHRMNLLQ
jgi:serine/threonine protein kinase/tetratricopeptide (TPR) repeat protein